MSLLLITGIKSKQDQIYSFQLLIYSYMQRITTTLFTICCLFLLGNLSAQTRYIDPMFEVGEPATGVYGQNVDVFLQGINQLEFDVYQPVDDTAALRPCVVMFPTGNFLLQYLNQTAYGSRKDSAIVEIINEVVSRGYVGFSAEYRTGWLPSSPDQDIRTSTLLQAAYRGGQDAHTMARYLRKTVAEEGNPYRIDTSKIVFWGVGTGGYVTMTHAFLDRVDEILADARFYNVEGQPYVNEAVQSNPQATLPAFFDPATMTMPSNIPNHVGYSSEVAMSINTGGALGDIDWIEGDNSPHQEPMVLGYHSLTDPFAPFSQGTVIVPTTGDVVITGVAGTEQILEKANELGLNDGLAAANAPVLPAEYAPLSSAVNQVNSIYKTFIIEGNPLNPLDTVEYELSHDNMFPAFWPGQLVSSAFNWINPEAVTAEIAAFNTATGQMINAAAVIGGESQTNPNYLNADAARTVIDTMIAHFIPRAYIGLDLETLVSTQELVKADAIGFTIAPNPAQEHFIISTNEGENILKATIFDFNGRAIASFPAVNTNSIRIERNGLAAGQYFVRIQVEGGIAVQKVLLH